MSFKQLFPSLQISSRGYIELVFHVNLRNEILFEQISFEFLLWAGLAANGSSHCVLTLEGGEAEQCGPEYYNSLTNALILTLELSRDFGGGGGVGGTLLPGPSRINRASGQLGG